MGFGFYNIWIIQSLPEGEWSTGRHLATALKEIPEAEEHVLLDTPVTAGHFLGVLQEIDRQLEESGRIPLLHIEAHGDEEGLKLASGEHIAWSDLKEIFTSINVACRNNLLVVLAACFGDRLVTINSPVERCPMWGCIGPTDEIPAGDLHDSFKAFYINFLETSDLRSAVDTLNRMAEGMPWRFSLVPAEAFLLHAFRAYVQQQGSDEKIAERLEYIVGELEKSHPEKGPVPLWMRSEIEAKLRDHKKYFERFKAYFLMEDLDPANKARFSITFTDVIDDRKHAADHDTDLVSLPNLKRSASETGNYTEERREMYSGLELDDLVAEIKRRRAGG
jgi:hypothetical protein